MRNDRVHYVQRANFILDKGVNNSRQMEMEQSLNWSKVLNKGVNNSRQKEMEQSSVNHTHTKNHHHHLSLNREGRWGTTDDFATRTRKKKTIMTSHKHFDFNLLNEST